MAMGTNKVSAVASPGMAAAATARTNSGGRNVASVGGAVEGIGFSSQIGVNDNGMWRNDDEFEFDSQKEGKKQQRGTPFIVRAVNGFKVDEAEEALDVGSFGKTFLDEILRGIGIYEGNMRIISPALVRRGSVLNFLY